MIDTEGVSRRAERFVVRLKSLESCGVSNELVEGDQDGFKKEY